MGCGKWLAPTIHAHLAVYATIHYLNMYDTCIYTYTSIYTSHRSFNHTGVSALARNKWCTYKLLWINSHRTSRLASLPLCYYSLSHSLIYVCKPLRFGRRGYWFIRARRSQQTVPSYNIAYVLAAQQLTHRTDSDIYHVYILPPL